MPIGRILSLTEEQLNYRVLTEKGKERDVASLCWADIASVTVFKRDIFAYDLICVQLIVSETAWVEFDEEDTHWAELMKALPLRLPGCRTEDEWYGDVVYPAFAENLHCIFERANPMTGAR